MLVLLIDTHVHIKFPQYDNDRDEMMLRAFDSGVKTMLHACCNTDEIEPLLTLAERYSEPDLYIAFGVHPTEIETWTDASSEIIRNAVRRELAKEHSFNEVDTSKSPLSTKAKTKLRAIGETGLDYYHVKDPEGQKLQREIFNTQIDIAQEFSLPLIVHTRDAWEDTLKLIQDRYKANPDGRSGVLHCYTGDAVFAQACIDRGFYVSWSGVVSFKNSPLLREAAKALPLERTLIETDCPYLAPQAKRGQRNEPSYVHYVAETLADVHGVTKEEICSITSANAQRLFKFS